MDTAIKKEFVLQGLGCAHCASEIEREIGGLKGVNAASVDFVNGTLSVEISQEKSAEEILKQAGSIIRRHDPEIVVREQAVRKAGRKTVFLGGLYCADCAREIEKEIGRIDGVRDVSLDLAAGRLTVEADDRGALPGILRQASGIVKRVEPQAEISYRGVKPQAAPPEQRQEKIRRIRLLAGALLFAAALPARGPQPVTAALFLASYVLAGGDVLFRSVRNLFRGRIFDENFLMSAATIGAFAIGEFGEGVAVMLFYQIGELFQRMAVDRSRRSITALMDIRPDYANLIDGGRICRVAPEEVSVGERILVKPGERVPLDGTVAEGGSAIDVSALTGESLPKDVGPGDSILSGSINQTGALTVEVSKEYADSTVAKILDLVQNAGSKKSVTENFITRFARWYTPAVVSAAAVLALLPPLVIPGAAFSVWFGRALIFLVVSCPCALVLSVPLSFFAGIGGASRSGILIKGSNYLEALQNVGTVVFDKTGTLTKGVFHVSKIESAGAMNQEALLDMAAHAEANSNHPIAVSIRRAYGKEPDRARIADASETAGQGISVTVDGRAVLAGNGKLMWMHGISVPDVPEPGTAVYLAVDGVYAGYLLISDEMKEDSRSAVEQLRKTGVRRLVMLTGDSGAAGGRISGELGLDACYAELLPQQKVEILERLKKEEAGTGDKTAFVGDGINDAPVLAAADVGIAMGGAGTDAAIEAADIVLMTDEPSRIPLAIRIARRTLRIVRQNIVFALGVKVVILVLGALGLATMWAAVFGDVGVALIAVFNAMRALRVPGAERGAVFSKEEPCR